jgi:transcriptional regulator with XRE-family HTH domain
MNMAERIRFVRTKAGLNKAELARQLGIINSNITNWENGTSTPDVDMLMRICDITGANPNMLFGWPEADDCADHDGDCISINKEEKEIILAFRSAAESSKHIVRLALFPEQVDKHNHSKKIG